MIDIKRIVIWFSAGVTSAVAAKLTVDRWKGKFPVHLVNTDTGSEDDDNYRFMNDIARWIDMPLEIIRNEKYPDTFAVYEAASFFKNRFGARCTVELKKKPRRMYEDLQGDLQVFGFSFEEWDRAEEFVSHNPEITTDFPLIDAKLTKQDCRRLLLEAGIKEPRTYAEGFNNANCLKRGCVKGGIGYWNFIRQVRPQVFWAMAWEERKIGFALNVIERDRIRTPVFLDELLPHLGNYHSEPAIQCGLFCQPPDNWSERIER